MLMSFHSAKHFKNLSHRHTNTWARTYIYKISHLSNTAKQKTGNKCPSFGHSFNKYIHNMLYFVMGGIRKALYVLIWKDFQKQCCVRKARYSYILQFYKRERKEHTSVLFVYALKISGRIYRRLIIVVTHLVESNCDNEEWVQYRGFFTV